MRHNYLKRRLVLIFSGACSLVIFSPRDSLAVGFKWPTAGPYVSEIAHLLFMGAMLFFIYEIRHAGLVKFRGFLYLLWAWALLALWNLDVFVGHWAAWTRIGPLILGEGWSAHLLLNDFYTWTVFITQVGSFILLVPAFYLFYRGIKALARIARGEHQ